MRKLALAVIVLTSLLLGVVRAQGPISEERPLDSGVSRLPRSAGRATVVLDGVTVYVTTSFLEDLRFATPAPDSAIQAAAAVERAPLFRELSITAVPFGASPPTEGLPPAGSGQGEVYRAALRAHRRRQRGEPRSGPAIRLFGAAVIGSTSVVSLNVRGPEPVPVAITEWVTGAGSRLWIVRATQELVHNPSPSEVAFPSAEALSDTVLVSADLTRPSSSLSALEELRLRPSEVFAMSSPLGHLPFPSWWDGECDTVNFQAELGAPAYPLGAEYRGMKACGPRPSVNGSQWRWVDFGAGNRQIEWQCPELSKRFLYLAYGIPPYQGNGNQVVTNYDGDLLEKVWNCTPGRAPQPDDVLSQGATTSYGHTSVVVASDVDAAGDGTIRVIEQNSSATGSSTLQVSDWCVVAYTDVIGWLHHPDWLLEYYADDALTHSCATDSRPGTYLFESDLASQVGERGLTAPGCPGEGFSVRFSRSLEFPGGLYTFALGYNGRARLAIDGEIIVDGWGPAGQHDATRTLEAGSHRLTVEYAHRGGDAALTAFWWGPGYELARETRDGARWYAEYWGNQTLWWDPVVMVRGGDGFLDHRWLADSPADGVPADHFSSRFRRTVSFHPGRWRFNLFADDGVRFWIDDRLIVDRWQDQVALFTPTVSLPSGPHLLQIEHYENLGHAKIGVDWYRISDDVAPAAWITWPLSGTVVEACPIWLEARIADWVGPVDRVEFHGAYRGQWHHLGDAHSAPYRLLWDCLRIPIQRVPLTVHVWTMGGDEFIDLDAPVEVVLAHLDPVYLPLVAKRHPDG